VVYLGQIAPRKGVDHLIEAFRSGAPAGATLVIAGPDMGGLAAALARASGAPSVRFLGLLEGEARLELLADADVLVYAGHSEVFGLVPFEGLLCGAPVVVADDCGCGEIIREAGAGLLVRYGDLEGLRARIGTLLEDRAAAAAMVRRGRRFIHDRLSFEVVAREHARMYREVIGARDELARGGAPGR
jgi:glycosyltransferase involved in cell wall biosynthesis